MKEYSARTRWIEPALLLLLTAIFGFFIATALCPLWPEGGFDSAVFVLTGKGWLSGLLPYRDLFDHKGPVLYALEALAMLPLRSGAMVWGMELLFFLASLLLLRAIARLEAIGPAARALTYISYTLLLATCLEKGNFSEEYSALFTLLAFWALTRALRKGFSPWTGVWMGAAFALSFWIRPNNTLPLCCAIVALVIWLLWRREWRAFAILAGTGLGTAGLISLAIVGYFAANGALSDLLSCYFTFNMQNVANFSAETSFAGLAATYFGRYSLMVLGLALCVAGYVLPGDRHKALPVLAAAAGTVAGLAGCWISHNPFFHYFLLAIPTLALVLLYGYQRVFTDALRLKGRLQNHRLSIPRTALWLLALYCGAVLANHALGTFAKDDHETVSTYLAQRLGTLTDTIPADEYADTLVIASDNLILWYDDNDQLPIKKYYFGYDFIAAADDRRKAEILAQFAADAPLWVLIDTGDAALEPTAGILTEHYALAGQNGDVLLYHLTA